MKRRVLLIISIVLLVVCYFFLFRVAIVNEFAEDKLTARIIFYCALISSILLIALITIISINSFRYRIKSLQNRLSRWSKLSPRVNQIGDDAFHELPIGILVLDDELNEIKWVNQYAKLIFDARLVDRLIADVNSDLSNFLESGQTKTIITIKNEYYDVLYRQEFQVLYIFNASERELIRKKYQERLPALGIFILDNLEENLADYDLAEQSSIKGEYLSAISDWVELYQGYLRLFGENRMIVISDRQSLDEMMKAKFSILEEIREISLKHQIRITLSIGIAAWDIPYNDLAVYAQNAIELAEKRGGDQAVINIQNQKIAYFGAKVDAASKNSRVNARFYAQTIKDALDQTDQVFIMGHTQSDFDSLASMIAMLKLAQSNAKLLAYLVIDEEKLDQSTYAVYQKLKEDKHRLLKDIKTTQEVLEIIDNESVLVILDTQSTNMVNSPELLTLTNKTIIIDHHRSNEQSISAPISYIDPSASSTIELMIELVNFFTKEISVDQFEANIMYAGLIVDTNTFTYRTTPKTFEVASKIREYGADTVMVKKWLRNDFDLQNEINQLVAKAEIYLDRFAIVRSSKTYKDRTFLAIVSQTLLDIKGIDAAFTITHIDENTVGISARSFSNINVQVIMEQMGGGGHLNSAATQIKDITIKDCYEQLKYILEIEYSGGDEPMKVILLEDVKGKGKKNEVIDVASGYGQYLISSKLALIANDENLKVLAKQKEDVLLEELRHLNLMKKLASEIEGKNITMTVQIGADGKRFGSITSAKIAQEFEKQYGITIDKKKMEVSSEINSAGIYTVSVNLHKQVKAQFEVNIIEEKR